MSTQFGIDFEYYCAGLLKSKGFTSVDVTQASGDQGIDVLAKKMVLHTQSNVSVILATLVTLRFKKPLQERVFINAI